MHERARPLASASETRRSSKILEDGAGVDGRVAAGEGIALSICTVSLASWID